MKKRRKWIMKMKNENNNVKIMKRKWKMKIIMAKIMKIIIIMK